MNTDKIYAESIAKVYAPKETSKVAALKKLDRKAKRPALIFAYTSGTVSALIFGLGMCLALQVIGSGTLGFLMGIIIGIVGIVLISINYPIYKKILTNSKNKYAYDIMTVTKEISEEA